MLLPGGLWEDGRNQRDFAFKPPNGEVELVVAEASQTGASLPAQVTAVLSACLSRLGDHAPTPDRAAALCIADRQFLMRRLAALLGGDHVWQNTHCSACDAIFDFQVRQTELPVSEPGPGYPFASVALGETRFRLRVPNGADQEVVAAIAEDLPARQMLAWLCFTDEEGKPDPGMLDEGVLAGMESVLEAVTPEAAVMVQSACPECGHGNAVNIDPYIVLQTTAKELYDEIHTLAINYHWDEAPILALPRARRRRYLDLINRARGLIT